MFNEGDTLGPYTIVRRLGAGAMGEVYQARHRHMGRDAAIKVLRAELTVESDVVSRFFTEARATASVRHPGIVEIFDCDLHRSGRAYIVMEYLAGEDLAARLGRGSFAGDWAGLRAVGRQVAGALAAAHALGIVHRDLKPGNIFLLAGDGAGAPRVKLVDFGIAKLLHRDGGEHSQTQTGHILGTPLYMSPEQARGAKTIDHRTDVYALGCVLFEMITGRPPFERRGPAQVIVAHLNEKAPSVSSLEATVPAALDALVAEMLAKSPDARPQTMNDVLARLAEPAPGHVATQLLGSGKGSGPVAAPPAVAPAAAPQAVPAPSIHSAPTRAGFQGREAQVLSRAASTTLGGSASEMAAATEHVARAERRPPWIWVGAAAAVVILAVGFGVRRSGSGDAAAPSAASAPPAASSPVAEPPPAAAPPPPAAVAAPEPAPAVDAGAAPKATHHHHKRASEFRAIED